MRRSTLAGARVLAVLLASVCAAQEGAPESDAARLRPTRPNVLWLSSEDIGPDLGCYGCAVADTPNLDALAAAGVVYTRCWSNAPVCAPARTTIITGWFASALGAEHMRSRVRLPDGVRPFPELLRAAGYWCTNRSKTDYNLSEIGEVWDESSPRAHWRGRAAGQPFFAVFNFTGTHESQVRTRAGKAVLAPAAVAVPPYHPDTPVVRADWARYHDNIAAMDRQAGRVLAELEADGLADDTVVFFWGDHGAGMPGHKRCARDAGLRVPLIVRVPPRWRAHAHGAQVGAQAGAQEAAQVGARDERLVQFVDLAPTVLSLAGIAPPASMHGAAFLGPHRTAPTRLLHGFRGRMDERIDLVRAVRDARFVYVRNFMPWLPRGQHVAYMFETPSTRDWRERFDAGELDAVQAAFWRARGAEELYDLDADPHETRDLAAAPEHRAVLEALRAEADRHALAIDDLGLLPEADMVARAGARSPRALLDGPAPIDVARLLAVAKRAAGIGAGSAASDAALFEETLRTADPALRVWALRGMRRLGPAAIEAHRTQIARLLDDASPSVCIEAAAALTAHADGALAERARGVLVAFADRRRAGLEAAVAAWNECDRLGAKMSPSREALRAIEVEGDDVPGWARAYLPRLREVTLASVESR